MLFSMQPMDSRRIFPAKEGYSHLSNRLMEKIEETRELEEQMQQYENLFQMLSDLKKQKMEMQEKERHGESRAENGLKGKNQASPASPGADESGSSHYSDDAFEDPEEDWDPDFAVELRPWAIVWIRNVGILS